MCPKLICGQVVAQLVLRIIVMQRLHGSMVIDKHGDLEKKMHIDLIVFHQKWQEKYLIRANILAKTIMSFENVQMHLEHFD